MSIRAVFARKEGLNGPSVSMWFLEGEEWEKVVARDGCCYSAELGEVDPRPGEREVEFGARCEAYRRQLENEIIKEEMTWQTSD